MKKFIIMLMTIALTVNLAACGKTPADSATNENVYENMDSDVAKAGSMEAEPYVSPFSEYYTDPDIGIEFKLRSTYFPGSYNFYSYDAQHVTYEGPFSTSSKVSYYLKKDTFDDDYYNIFELSSYNPHVGTCYQDFFAWLEDFTEPDSNRCNLKLYKFVYDSSTSSIQLEKKSLKNSISQMADNKEETTIEYTDDQLERYDRYREESDAEFIEDYMTNDLDHYEEDLDTILEALELAIQEAENEKAEKLRLRTNGEKLPDSDNIGYLLTYENKNDDDSTKACEPTRFNIIYGYDAELDEFCVSITGRHLAKEHNYETDTYEKTAYDFEAYLAAMLSNLIRITDEQVPQEEGIAKTLYVYEDIKTGNAIKIYDETTYEPRFQFNTKTGYGIFDENFKEKFFVSKFDYNAEEIEFFIKDYQYKNYYASYYYDSINTIAVYFKPLLELKPGDPIIFIEPQNDAEVSSQTIEQVIDELDTMEIIYSYTEQYHNQQLPDHNAEMNIHTGMFKESDVKDYYTYELFNDVGITVTVPEFYNSDFNNSEGMCNVVEYLERTTDLGYSKVSLCFSRFCRSEEDIENQKQYSSNIEEWDINGHHCYLTGNEWDTSCTYTIFIEAKPSQYVQLESVSLEGSYYYDKETYKESLKNLISLIEIK